MEPHWSADPQYVGRTIAVQPHGQPIQHVAPGRPATQHVKAAFTREKDRRAGRQNPRNHSGQVVM